MASTRAVKRRAADSSALEAYDDEHKNTAAGGEEGLTGIAGGGSKEGYGKHIIPMYTRNIFSQGDLKYNYTLKRQEYCTLNFAENIEAIVLPYQCLHWYVGDTGNGGNNADIWDLLCQASWGMSLHGARIAIEVYAVTRERLLQGGATNYKTYDFETSQNLFLSRGDRLQCHYYYPTNVPTRSRVPFNAIRWAEHGTFSLNFDHFTREEIPQRETKIINIKFPKLNHNYAYPPMNVSSMRSPSGTKTWVTQIPGPTGYTGPGPNLETIVGTGNNTEIFYKPVNNEVTGLHTEQSTIQNRSTYPMMILHSPDVPDETGDMKWVYQVRISTELFATFHIKPDFGGQGITEFLHRQVVNLPVVINENNGGTVLYNTRIGCVPYEAKT